MHSFLRGVLSRWGMDHTICARHRFYKKKFLVEPIRTVIPAISTSLGGVGSELLWIRRKHVAERDGLRDQNTISSRIRRRRRRTNDPIQPRGSQNSGIWPSHLVPLVSLSTSFGRENLMAIGKTITARPTAPATRCNTNSFIIPAPSDRRVWFLEVSTPSFLGVPHPH